MMNNKISFKKCYSNLEQNIIKIKINRILKELEAMNVGISSFVLNEEVTIVYKDNTLYSKFTDNPDCSYWYDYDAFHPNNYPSLVLFLIKWEDIKNDLLIEKQYFDKKESEVLNIDYSKDDGVEAICDAIDEGADINIANIFDLENLTDDDKFNFVKRGYGYDLYDEKYNDAYNSNYNDYGTIPHLLNKLISKNFVGHSLLNDKDLPKLKEWIENNPDKCLRLENRK